VSKPAREPKETAPIIEVTPERIDQLADHINRHHGESGHEGDIVFTPFEPDEPFVRERFLERQGRQLRTSLEADGWRRVWGIEQGADLVAHVDLQAQPLPTMKHRVLLGIGVERAHRGRGYGRALMGHAIAWARSRGGVDYIDLDVFAHNARARALYAALGFVEVGVTTDKFRTSRGSIDDVHMVLDLRATP
jgi:ribosomal protein S18 acetylase RimI-like enzyme